MPVRGHSVTEYAIIGFLLVLVAIPAVGGLGGQVDALLSGNGQALSNADGLFSLLGGGSGGGAGVSQASGDPAASADSAIPQDASGAMASLENSYASMGLITTSVSGQQDLAAAAAASGASSVAADKLRAFEESILNLEANGEITPEQATMMRNLSSQGYRIAEIEALLEQAQDPTAPIVFDGTTYSSITALADQIGWQYTRPDTFAQTIDPLDPNGANINPENQKFLELYQQVDASLIDPELKTWTAGIAQEITLLSEAVEDASYEKSWDASVDLKEMSASAITKYDAGLFCEAGSGSAEAACK